MGTPHRASGFAGRTNALLAIIKKATSIYSFGVSVEKRLLKGFKSSSEELWEIGMAFAPLTRDIYRIVTCVEQFVLPGMTRPVSGVPRPSLSLVRIANP